MRSASGTGSSASGEKNCSWHLRPASRAAGADRKRQTPHPARQRSRCPGGGSASGRTGGRQRCAKPAARLIAAALHPIGGAVQEAARSARFPACTSPRCRDGRARTLSRGQAAQNRQAERRQARAQHRGVARRADLVQDDASDAHAGSWRANPATSGATDCAMRAASTTSTTGRPRIRARSARRRAVRRGAVKKAHRALDHQQPSASPPAREAAPAASPRRRG